MSGEIVVGYDGSEASRSALSVAVGAAAAFDTPLVIAFAYGQNPVGGVTGDLRRSVEEIGRGLLAEGAGLAARLDPTVTIVSDLVDGRPAEGLVALTARLDARMLVVGSAERGPVMGSLLGSTAYKVLHLSPVPVLMVPHLP